MADTETLRARIARRIRAEGPISIAAFMAMALHDPEAGYYARHDPLGAAGDFITAPEISQIFGELVGLWCADVWLRSGRPEPVNLVELGPGRGVLMQDLLRAAKVAPDFRRSLRLHLVETSPVLQAEQRRRLAEFEPAFAADLSEVPPGPLLLVANEFLDALPIRQIVRGRSEWRERLVTVAGADPQTEDRLVFTEGPENPVASLLVPLPLRQSPPGTVVEICPAAAALGAALGERLAQAPGAALFVDYGYCPSAPGPTLAAVRGHRGADPLNEPGAADLSAHVDFAAFSIAAQAAGAAVYGPVEQGRFLTALGAGTRLRMLADGACPTQRERLEGGITRLIDPAAMGSLFKAIALTSPGLPAPAGFAADGQE